MIKDRLKEFIDFKGINKTAFYTSTGISNGVLTQKSGMSEDGILRTLSTFPEINPDWLLMGKGSMLRSQTSNNMSVEKPSPDQPDAGIPLLPIDAFAGGFTGEVQVMDHDAPRYVIPSFGKADFMITVKGSSMYPKYSSGDLVACKRLYSWKFFQWGKVYVLYTNQGPIIKRVCEGKDEHHVEIVSENKEMYRPFQLPISEIVDVAIVIGVVRLE